MCQVHGIEKGLVKEVIDKRVFMCMNYTHKIHLWRCNMRTNIVLDDTLMNKALKIGGLKTKKATKESALRLFIQIKGQLKIKKLKGKIHWEGNLEEMRRD